MIEIRPMRKEDIDGVLEVEHERFANPWSKKAFEKEIKNSFARYLVAKDGERVIGYGGVWLIIDEGHITNIAVSRKHCKKRVGSKILLGLIEICKKRDINSMTLEVRKSNEAAKRLYKKHGFKQVGIRPKYYTNNNEDAIIMWLTF